VNNGDLDSWRQGARSFQSHLDSVEDVGQLAGETYHQVPVAFHSTESNANQSQLMAVSVQAPLYSKSGMWSLGDPPAAFSSDSDALPPMAYPYPMGSSGLESSSNMIPSYHHLSGEHTQPNSPADAKSSSPSLKNRGTSAGSKSAKIKRSMSTPNVRGQASADAAALALSAEKRRNKLGYHRTSVACGKNEFHFITSKCLLLRG
jgi:hypothetical protein